MVVCKRITQFIFQEWILCSKLSLLLCSIINCNGSNTNQGTFWKCYDFSWQCASPPPQRRATATLLAWKTEWMIDKSSGARLSCCRLHTSLACLRLCSRVQRHHPISSCSSKETRWLLDGVVYSMISIIRPGCFRLLGLETWDKPGRLIESF